MKNIYKDKTLIELVDETLREITSDQWCADEGCDTCGYGSSYITQINFMFDKCYVNVKDDSSYKYGNLTGTFFLKFFINNLEEIKKMSFEEFLQFATVELEKVCRYVTVEVKNYQQ